MLATVFILSILLALAIACIVAQMIFGARARREREKAVAESVEALRSQFSALAADQLELKTQSLINRNREEVSAMADNLRDDILRSMKDLRDSTTEAVRETSKIGAQMLSGVADVQESARLLGFKTEGLEQALKGGGKRQGIWGEAVLAEILKSSGLKEGVNFWLQKGSEGAGIPDAEVLDPAGRILVIDSKTSLTAYMDSFKTTDKAEVEKRIGAHVVSVRNHIRDLHAKEYIERLRRAHPDKTYLPVIALFMPSDGAYTAAMDADPTIMQFAVERDVAIVTPLTLQSYLRIVALAWQQENVERSHIAIVEKAALLLERVNSALVALESLGSSMNDAREEYEKVMGLVGCRDGARSIVKPAKDLIDIGIKLDKKCRKAKALTMEAETGE